MFGSVDEYLDYIDRQDESLELYELGVELDERMRYFGYHPDPVTPFLYVDEFGNPVPEETAFCIYDEVIEQETGEWAQIIQKKPNYRRLDVYRKMCSVCAKANYGEAERNCT